MPSKIEWCDETWPVVTGCTPCSVGCTNCYAARLAATRLKHHPRYAGLAEMQNGRPRWTGKVRLNRDVLEQPLHWRKPRRVFVASMGDLFHEDVPDFFISKAFRRMLTARHHTYQILTKRPDRMAEYLQEHIVDGLFSAYGFQYDWPVSNIWPGVTIENQQTADERRDAFRASPAAVKFVSYEPALGPVDWTGWEFVDQIISGGETGPCARPSHPDWHRATRDFCRANGIKYFFKAWGEWEHSSQCVGSHTRALLDGYYWNDDSYSVKVGKKRAGRLLDGAKWSEMP